MGTITMSLHKSYVQPAWKSARGMPRAIYNRYKSLNTVGKVLVWLILTFELCMLAAFIIITPGRIFQFLYDTSHKIAALQFGYLIFGVAIIIVSYPPLAGHSTFVTLCGYTYGMKGFWMAAIASSLGSAIVFLTMRFFFSRRLHKWASNNEKWSALDTVIQSKGLPLIILIRASPMPPWTYANVLFSSIEAVKFWQFVIATLFYWPKLALQVFVGSRIAALSDGEERKHMDTQTKAVNGLLIGFGIIVAIISGGVTYHLMKKQIHQTQSASPRDEALADEAIDDVNEGAPLLRSFSGDIEERA